MLHKDIDIIVKVLAEGINIEYYYVAEIGREVVGFISLVENDNRAFSIPIELFKKHFGFFKGFMIGMALKHEFEQPLNLPDDTAYIDILGVAKKAQGYGVGTKLIQHLISVINKKYFTLTVTNINQNAIQCYQKNGFVEYNRKTKGSGKMIYMKLDNLLIN